MTVGCSGMPTLSSSGSASIFPSGHASLGGAGDSNSQETVSPTHAFTACLPRSSRKQTRDRLPPAASTGQALGTPIRITRSNRLLQHLPYELLSSASSRRKKPRPQNISEASTGKSEMDFGESTAYSTSSDYSVYLASPGPCNNGGGQDCSTKSGLSGNDMLNRCIVLNVRSVIRVQILH
ncbi:unnamed protein product [Protopolystoma xenopodis]|uniref:Uncharacterized protein n=1 Tax=Protopolystoma xenopodis TaxID=117903 RepID=A0A448WDK2_9PLAT|nr:unnamed protein product [Protopolystoma xenopodis]